MKKFILLPLAFTIAMTFFSLSCLESLIAKIEAAIDENTSSVITVEITGTGTTRKVTAMTPPASILDDNPGEANENTYILYYVNAKLAYPDITPGTDIAEFLPKTGEELATKAKDLIATDASGKVTSNLASPGPETSISFTISSLEADTVYLYVIETFHSERINSYTPVTAEKGSFKTAEL